MCGLLRCKHPIDQNNHKEIDSLREILRLSRGDQPKIKSALRLEEEDRLGSGTLQEHSLGMYSLN